MFETSVNEVAHSAVPAQLPVIQSIDLNFVHSDRIISDDSRLRSDLKLAKAVQRQMLPRNTKQLATIRRILDRHHAWTVPAQAAPDQLTLLAELVIHVVEALRPARLTRPARKRVKRKQKRAARGGVRNVDVDAAAVLVDDPLPW